MSRFPTQIVLLVAVAIAVAACGSQTGTPSTAVDPAPTSAGARPASATVSMPAIAPAGDRAGRRRAGVAVGRGGAEIVGDVNAHAPPLAEVKRELQQLNLCGGATSRAEATPIVKSAAPGFVADPGTNQDEGQLPQLTAQLERARQGARRHDLRDQRLPHAGAQRRGRRVRRRPAHQGRGRGHRRQQPAALERRSDQRGRARTVRALPAVRPVRRSEQHRGQPHPADPGRRSADARPVDGARSIPTRRAAEPGLGSRRIRTRR